MNSESTGETSGQNGDKCENRSVAEGGTIWNSKDPEKKKNPRDPRLRDVAGLEELPAQMTII